MSAAVSGEQAAAYETDNSCAEGGSPLHMWDSPSEHFCAVCSYMFRQSPQAAKFAAIVRNPLLRQRDGAKGWEILIKKRIIHLCCVKMCLSNKMPPNLLWYGKHYLAHSLLLHDWNYSSCLNTQVAWGQYDPHYMKEEKPWCLFLFLFFSCLLLLIFYAAQAAWSAALTWR